MTKKQIEIVQSLIYFFPFLLVDHRFQVDAILFWFVLIYFFFVLIFFLSFFFFKSTSEKKQTPIQLKEKLWRSQNCIRNIRPRLNNNNKKRRIIMQRWGQTPCWDYYQLLYKIYIFFKWLCEIIVFKGSVGFVVTLTGGPTVIHSGSVHLLNQHHVSLI